MGMGDVFAIIEPDQVMRALKGDLPLINTSKPLYPLVNSGFALVVHLLVVPGRGWQATQLLSEECVGAIDQG
jgi:hypothetical protein